MRERTSSLAAVLTAVPWCCLVPAAFALAGVAGAGVARLAAVQVMPALLGVSILMLGRAHYLIHLRQQGSPWSRRIVWIATALVAVMWGPRLWY